MTTNLVKQKENLEAYIRSTGYNTRGMNVEHNHVLIEKPILDSYEDEHQRKELVDLVNVIETRTRGGKYEVTDFESDSLQEISENFVERTESDKKKTISVDYLVKLFSGKLDFSQEQLDDGQYNLTDFLGKKIIKLKRRTRNREIGKILQTAKVQTATSLDDLKSIVSLINPERNVSIVLSRSLFSVLEKMKDTSGNYLLKVDKETGTSETFFVDNFLIVDDTTLGNEGDKKGFIGDLENFVTLFDRKKDTLSWVNANDYFRKRLVLHTRFDVKKVEEDCGYFIQWNQEEEMDINQVFETLDDLDNKKSKINSAREQLSEKKKSLLGNQIVSFENINSFLSNNLESLEQLEKMEKAINSLQEKYNSDFSEAKAVIFEYIFKETKQRMETKKIYKQYRKKLRRILDAYDEIQELKKDVEEIHTGVVREISQKHSLSLYRTEVSPLTVLPFLTPDSSGWMDFSKEYRDIKEYLEKQGTN